MHSLRLLAHSLINVKSSVKGNGQEYPFHTCNVKGNIDLKNDAVGVRASHPFDKLRACAKNAQGWGKPPRFLGTGNQNPHFSQRTRKMGTQPLSAEVARCCMVASFVILTHNQTHESVVKFCGGGV
jgi:hypothetical protein